ncbi:hypothetical protein PR048_002213 [Dryococelus australis]|uniref:Uncharacterized protein n=1 Tax=Dryococelus australis TaxID=614101 RepID=A0ABQ9IJJ9_9NEOP|nr:hypothetical protein PR048_002213 [Dryococelus australis]
MRDVRNWKQTKCREARYKAKSLPRAPQCGHNTKSFKCSAIGIQDIRRFYQSFYNNSRKSLQDAFMLKYTSQSNPIMTSRGKVPGSSRKKTTNSYFIQTKQGPVKVCAKTFLEMLGVSDLECKMCVESTFKLVHRPKKTRVETGGQNGHSILPPDRIFGRIEKVIIKRETIITPDEYLSIFREFGQVKILRPEVPVLDWKQTVQVNIKPPGTWHFRFSQAKRFILTKTTKKTALVKGELHYKRDTGVAAIITKRRKSLSSINTTVLESKVPVKCVELADVNNLLGKHHRTDCRERPELVYYKMEIDDTNIDENEPEANDTHNWENVADLEDLVV